MTAIPTPHLRFFTSSNVLAENINLNGAFLSQNNIDDPVVYEDVSGKDTAKYQSITNSIGANLPPPYGTASFLYFLPALYTPPTDEMTLNFFWKLNYIPEVSYGSMLFCAWKTTYPNQWIDWIEDSGQLRAGFGETIDTAPILVTLNRDRAKEWSMITYVLEQDPTNIHRKKISLYLNGVYAGGHTEFVDSGAAWQGFPVSGIGIGAYRNTNYGVRANYHKMELWEEKLSPEQIYSLYETSQINISNTGEWKSQLLDPSKASFKNVTNPSWGMLFLDRPNVTTFNSMTLDILDQNEAVLLENLQPTTTTINGTTHSNEYNLSDYSFSTSPIKIRITITNPIVGDKTSVKNIRLNLKDSTSEQIITKQGIINILDNISSAPTSSTLNSNFQFGINQDTVSNTMTSLTSPITTYKPYEVVSIDELNDRIKLRFRTRTDTLEIPNNVILNTLSVNTSDSLFAGIIYNPIRFYYNSIPTHYTFDVTFQMKRKGTNSFITNQGARQILERNFTSVSTYSPINEFSLGETPAIDILYNMTSLSTTHYGPTPVTSINVDVYEPYLTVRSYLPDTLGNLNTYDSIGIYDSSRMLAFGKMNKPIIKTDEYYYIFTMRYRPLLATYNIG